MSKSEQGSYAVYSGSGVNDNDLLFTTDEVSKYDLFMLHSSAGAVDVEALMAVDGAWTTVALSLDPLCNADTAPVVVTSAGSLFGFTGNFHKIRVRQNGATAATAYMRAWKLGH
jgi:hypothetical protein